MAALALRQDDPDDPHEDDPQAPSLLGT